MLLKIKNLCKEYKNSKVSANDDVSFSVDKGEVFGLLGPNGAGKSTIVNQIIGLVKPTSGTISISGVDVVGNPDYARQVCSFQAQGQAPINGLTAMQSIELVGRIRGGMKPDIHKRALDLIEMLEISEWKNTIGMKASGGVRRLIAFCMAIIVPGDIVILDEPTNDVDPLRRRLLWNAVRSISEKGSAVILVTHNVLEAERVVDRLAIIDQGRIIGMGTPAEFKKSEGDNLHMEMIMEPGMKPPEFPEYLSNAILKNRRMISKVNKKNAISALDLANTYKEQGIVEEFSIGPATLEDAYLRAIGRSDTIDAPGGVI